MRKIILTAITLIILNISNAFACEIEIKKDKNDYKVGDYVIFTVTIEQDHNRCLHDGEEPIINQSGLELLGKTTFTEISNNIWEIKYKAKITDNNATFTAIRECTKGGDRATVKIDAK